MDSDSKVIVILIGMTLFVTVVLPMIAGTIVEVAGK